MMTVTYGEGISDMLRKPDPIDRLEIELLTQEQAEIVTEHIFKDGVYERKITIPPWVVLTGAEHKTNYRVRIEIGTIAVTTDDGVKVLTGPCEFEAFAGIRRVGRVFEDDVVWVDVYDNPDNETDISILEDRLYVVPDIGLADSRTSVQKDRLDYRVFIHQLGMTPQQVTMISQIEHDLIEMPQGWDVEVRESEIHGDGMFALREFEIGETICPGRLDGKRTPAGRFINHSPKGNVLPTKIGDDIWVIAKTHISNGDELTVDYRDSMFVNFGLNLRKDLP